MKEYKTHEYDRVLRVLLWIVGAWGVITVGIILHGIYSLARSIPSN